LEHKAQVAPPQPCTLVARQCFDVDTLEQVLARGGRIQAAHDVHDGGFARAAGAHNGHELAGGDVEVDVPEREQFGRALAIAFGHAAQLDE
jgi:hypothetical protein